MKLTYKNQMWVSMISLVVCFILAIVLRQRLLNNAAWVIYGLPWLINPVFPSNVTPKKSWYTYMRLTGAVIVLFGMTSYLGV